MKINFHNQQNELNWLINRPQSSSSNPVQFRTTLADLISQPSEIPRKFAGNLTSESSESSTSPLPLASMYPKIGMSAPTPGRQEPLVESDTLDEVTVKTPSVVRIERLPSNTAQELAALPRNQRESKIQKMVAEFGKEHGIDPALSLAVVSAESSFNPLAISSDGHSSKGLMQLLDSTGEDLLNRSAINASYDPFDPKLNLDLGIRYLKYLDEIFANQTKLPNKRETVAVQNSSEREKFALAAYNAGEGRVASAQSRATKAHSDATSFSAVEPYLPESTRSYVKKVLEFKAHYSDLFQRAE